MGILRYSDSGDYFNTLPVTYSKYNQPLVDVNLGDHIQLRHVRVGSKFPLFLTKETLKKLDKKPHGMTTWHESDGQSYDPPSYLIPKMKIGDLTLTKLIATQAQEDGCNAIGRCLGGDLNLLLDFLNSRIIACNSFSKLKTKGFADDS